MLYRDRDPNKGTSPLIWCAAIVCMMLAVVVIIAGVTLFIGYLIVRPKVPYVRVTQAHLDSLNYDQYGQMDTRMSIDLTAKNDNANAHARFSDFSFILRFNSIQIAILKADPFEVAKNDSNTLSYQIQSSSVPLGMEASEEMDASLKQNKITFNLEGNAKTNWRVGFLGSVKFWTHLSCPLQFATNGTTISLHCTSKSH